MSERGRSAVVLATIALLLVLSAPPWPDDWDGLGFIASIDHFDLGRFAPHPPGYPVYVALLRVAALVTPTPIAAATAVAAASVVTALAALGACVRLWGGARSLRFAAPVTFCVLVACPLVWRTGSAVGSEAPALACSALGLWGIVRSDGVGALLTGVALGLGLGIRVSWAPVFLPMLLLVPRAQRWHTCGVAFAAILAWALPFVAIVGPQALVRLSSIHLLGHAAHWGGTALTEPARVRYLARDFFVDGLGAGLDPLGVALGVAGVAVGALALLVWRDRSWHGVKPAAVIVVPYLAWIAIGQNLRQQPRHVLPLVVAVALGIALSAVLDVRARVAVAVWVALLSVRTAIDAHDRLRYPPPGEQLVELVRKLPDAERMRVYGGASVRFFEPTELASVAKNVGDFGDIVLDLGRLPQLPTHVVVTHEVTGLELSPYPVAPLAKLSRPDRIDRHAPELDVYEVRLPGGPSLLLPPFERSAPLAP